MEEEKKIALVTGASNGLGKATAIELGRCGFFVIVNYNSSEDAAKDTLEQIKACGGDGIIYKCNVSDYDATNEMFKFIKKEYKTVDVLVNNAGITKDGYFIMMSKENFDSVIQTNLGGCFNCAQNAVRLMISSKRGGSIINISSTSGVIGQEGQANYSASKGAIISFTKTLAKEYANKNIRVNAIAPGFIETKMTQKTGNLLKDKYQSLIPAGRFGEPKEIATVARFLATEDSSYVTGQCIVVAGGLVM